MALHEHEHLQGITHPDLCPKCGQGVSDCATFGCNPCSLCGEPEEAHVLWLVELPVISQRHGTGPLCPDQQLVKLDIFTKTEEED